MRVFGCSSVETQGSSGGASDDCEEAGATYDIEDLYRRFRGEEPEVCRSYLLGRGIAPELVEEMIGEGTVLHNRYQGRSYCCFAVRDTASKLRCLDNHSVEGKEKFILGSKAPFSLEWEALEGAKVVFVAEGIIDYLSVKSLEAAPPPGLALLGNQLCFDHSLLASAEVIVSAMDDDRGGNSAVLDLKAAYLDKDVRIYELEGHKDPNELLQAVRSGRPRKLSPERKLQLYQEFQSTANKAELARRWGIDRSYLYEVVRDCDKTLVESLSSRRRGRPPKGVPTTLNKALERIKQLEAQYEGEATAREEFYCRSELLALRLKWAEIEAAELRGEPVDDKEVPKKKPQIKKKRSGRR